ncbi:hypothetical protein AAG570_013117 [Ranatra chinensis]|uniref:Outer dense fiber protein 3 n=1 Tax=Ranatra chinensis TaxID=642074 RepID=A0ABD0YGD0_9HEMI
MYQSIVVPVSLNPVARIDHTIKHKCSLNLSQYTYSSVNIGVHQQTASKGKSVNEMPTASPDYRGDAPRARISKPSVLTCPLWPGPRHSIQNKRNVVRCWLSRSHNWEERFWGLVFHPFGPSTGPRKQSTTHGRMSTDVTLPIVSVQFDQGIPSGAPKDGPGMYNISEVTRFGRISKPGVKFGTHDHLKFSPSDNPASNHYSIDDSCLRKNIAYSMGRRVNIQTGSLSPPPNLYALKSSDPAPGVTKFAPDVGRQKKAECNGNPGPNHYAVPSVEKYKRGSPKYTIGLKPESKVSETPSPNHYFPNHEKTQASVSLNGRPKGESVVCFTAADIKTENQSWTGR